MKFHRISFTIAIILSIAILSSCTKKDVVEEKMGDLEIDQVGVKSTFNITLRLLDGTTINILDGEKTYIKYWATWCPVCVDNMPELVQLIEDNPDFRILTVVNPRASGELTEQEIIEWLDENGYNDLPVLLDNGSLNSKINLRAFPTSVYIDSNGEIKDIGIGHNDNERIIKTMKRLK